MGFNNLNTLKIHINTIHKEDQQSDESRQRNHIMNNVSTTSVNQKQCVFYLQPRGCKKGMSCDFSHSTNIQQNNITKIPKVCFNGVACNWKPICRYVHPEDGEAIPVRAVRGGGNLGVQRSMRNQDFASPDVSQLPPGYRVTSMRQFPGLAQNHPQVQVQPQDQVQPQVWRHSIFKQNPQFQ